jgi:plasmid stability protein
MGSMVVRNIPDDVLRAFKERAKADGKSAEQLLREMIGNTTRPSGTELVRLSRQLRSMSPRRDMEETLRLMEDVRQERDARPEIPDLPDDR